MLLIKTTIGPSKIHGTGLFADEFIPKGTRIWEFSPETDKAYTKEEVESFPEPKRSEILSLIHTYIDKSTGKYIAEGDDSRFTNHSFHPNTELLLDRADGGIQIAARDINKREEITIDYRRFAAEGINFDVKEAV